MADRYPARRVCPTIDNAPLAHRARVTPGDFNVMSRSNISYATSAELADICKGIFKNTGTNCFSYSRVYDDRSRTELWTDLRALEHVLLKKRYILGTYTPCYYRQHERYALVESKIESFPADVRRKYTMHLLDLRMLFDHANPFEIVAKLDGYCESFSFYSSASRQSAASFYINHLDTFEQFVALFKVAAANLVATADRDRVIGTTAASERSSREPDSQAPLGTWDFLNARLQSLTDRQLEIAQHIISGCTARQIAQKLGLSSRTVETHIENIKSRLGCANKTELLVQFSHLRMI